MVNFPTLIPDCDSYSPALFDFFFLSSEASICSTMAIFKLSASAAATAMDKMSEISSG